MKNTIFRLINFLCISIFITACGFSPPIIEEPWEEVELPLSMEFRITNYIFCEVVLALKYARTNLLVNGKPAIPDDFGVQMQTTLTMEEGTSLNPGLTLNRTFADVFPAGVRVGQNSNIGLGGSISSTATSTHTSYHYFNIGRVSGSGKNDWCSNPQDQHGSSPLLQSSLGIKEFLKSAAPQARLFASSPKPKANKDAKLDVYSYDVKFVIVASGSINPSWKLVDISANTGSSQLFTTSRKRTHQLVLTFGPGDQEPTPAALQTHFIPQIARALNDRQSPF